MGRRRKRRKTARNRDASVKDFPFDILFDILSRLPVKSLARFRCVCKHWRSILSDQTFVDSHFMRSRDRPGGSTLLVSLSTYFKPGLSFFTADHQEGTVNPTLFLNQSGLLISKVSESLNGLIFLEYDDLIYVCNLSTREIINLPPANQESVSLGAKMLSFFSFGFDPATKQYKILKTWVEFTSDRGRVTMHKVLTLGTNLWRPIKCSSIEIPKQESVCVNGAIHFRTSDLLGNMVIVAFDVGVEEFRTITLPEAASFLGHNSTLMKLKERLTVVDYEQLVDFSMMKMWILDDYENQVWTEQRIMLPFYWNYIRANCINFLVGSIHTGEIILAPRLVDRNLFVFYYDTESNSMRKVELPGSPEDICQSAGPYFIKIAPIDHVESILSPRELRI